MAIIGAWCWGEWSIELQHRSSALIRRYIPMIQSIFAESWVFKETLSTFYASLVGSLLCQAAVGGNLWSTNHHLYPYTIIIWLNCSIEIFKGPLGSHCKWVDTCNYSLWNWQTMSAGIIWTEVDVGGLRHLGLPTGSRKSLCAIVWCLTSLAKSASCAAYHLLSQRVCLLR